MKRIAFLQSVLGFSVAIAIPNKLQADTQTEFRFNDVFEQSSGNENLFYPKKDCEIYKEIKKLIGQWRILDGKHFTCYLGYHQNLIPVKEKYNISDFIPFVLATKSYYHKNTSFAETEKGTFFRMIRERDSETMHFDVFLGDVRGQYHS